MATEHASAQHAPQHGHQQAGGYPLAHHIPNHQRPTPPLPAKALQLGLGGDEVVVVATHLKGWPAAGGQLHPLNQRTIIRQQLCLDLGTDAELAIQPLMAAQFLGQQLIFQRYGGEIGHQLQMAAVHLTPTEALPGAEHIEAGMAVAAGHHRGGLQAASPP